MQVSAPYSRSKWRRILLWSITPVLLALILVPAEIVRRLPTAEDTSGGLQLRVRPRALFSDTFSAEVVNVSSDPILTRSDDFSVSSESSLLEGRTIDAAADRILRPGESRSGFAQPSVPPAGSLGFTRHLVRYEDVSKGPCWRTIWTFDILGRRLAIK